MTAEAGSARDYKPSYGLLRTFR